MLPNLDLDSDPTQVYERYLVPALFVPATRLMLQWATPRVGEHVLDVACGTGIVSRKVAPMVGPEGKAIGIDISPTMLTLARSLPQPEGAAIEWYEGNALFLPFPDNTFDVALCQQALQFFPDKVAALREMRRVVKPNGRVVLSVQQSLQHNLIYQMFNNSLLLHLGVPALAAPFSFGDAGRLKEVMTEAGLGQVEVESISHPVHFPSVALFIQATVLGSGAAISALAGLDSTTRMTLVEKVSQDLNEILSHSTSDGALVFPMAANLGRGLA